jgi:predicted transposase/invertase (TIGR01784 family)
MSGIHNNFIQELFKDPKNAVGFLEKTLPEDLASITDFSSLVYEDTTFIDPELKDYQTDLLFSFATKDGVIGKYYLLFEHKSYSDKDTALQMAGYLIQCYKDQRSKKEGEYLIPVIPFLFSQGIDGEWKTAVTLSGLFSEETRHNPVFSRFIPKYDAILIDMAKENLARFRSYKLLYSGLTLLKYAKTEIWEPIEEALGELFAEEKSVVIRKTLVLYFIKVGGLKPEELKEKILNPKVRQEMMTTAEMLIQQGMEKGIAKGIEKGSYSARCQTAKAMIMKKLNLNIIAEVTDLPMDTIRELAREADI